MEEGIRLVVDTGTFTTKVGKVGELLPSHVVPTLVAFQNGDRWWRSDPIATGKKAEDLANDVTSNVQFQTPADRGHITNWTGVRTLWRDTFDEMGLHDLHDVPVLCTEPIFNSIVRITINQVIFVQTDPSAVESNLFEEFDVPYFYICNTTYLAGLAAGVPTGTIVDCGHDATYISLVWDSQPCPSAVPLIKKGGGAVTGELLRLLAPASTSKLSSKTVREIKDKLCFCAIDENMYIDTLPIPSVSCTRFQGSLLATLPLELQQYIDKITKFHDLYQEYTLPDGSVLSIGKERFAAPKILFGDPWPISGEVIYNSIANCEPLIRDTICSNIVLCGGGSLLRGFSDVLHKQFLETLAENQLNYKVNWVCPPNREYLAWIGGSQLAATMPLSKWISRDEYNEQGPSIVHRKCT